MCNRNNLLVSVASYFIKSGIRFPNFNACMLNFAFVDTQNFIFKKNHFGFPTFLVFLTSMFVFNHPETSVDRSSPRKGFLWLMKMVRYEQSFHLNCCKGMLPKLVPIVIINKTLPKVNGINAWQTTIFRKEKLIGIGKHFNWTFKYFEYLSVSGKFVAVIFSAKMVIEFTIAWIKNVD